MLWHKVCYGYALGCVWPDPLFPLFSALLPNAHAPLVHVLYYMQYVYMMKEKHKEQEEEKFDRRWDYARPWVINAVDIEQKWTE